MVWMMAANFSLLTPVCVSTWRSELPMMRMHEKSSKKMTRQSSQVASCMRSDEVINSLASSARPWPPPPFCTTPMVPPSTIVNSSTPAWSSRMKASTQYLSKVRRKAAKTSPLSAMVAPHQMPANSATITCPSSADMTSVTIGGSSETHPGDTNSSV